MTLAYNLIYNLSAVVMYCPTTNLTGFNKYIVVFTCVVTLVWCFTSPLVFEGDPSFVASELYMGCGTVHPLPEMW